MPMISPKRQITLPAEQCPQAGLAPGDEYESYVDNFGRITIVKKNKGAAQGFLKDIKSDKRVSEESSRNCLLNHEDRSYDSLL